MGEVDAGGVGETVGGAGVPPAGAPPIVLDARLEQQFQDALNRIRHPKRISQGLLLVGSLVVFMVAQRSSSDSLRSVVVLIGILLFHELGHYAGMRLFGYRDVRMFFIPFFGAAVSGKKTGVEAWKDGVVTLLGPVPGILVGFVLGASPSLSPTLRELASSMVWLNAFNLLPLAGLDGARLLQHVLFSRHRWLELGFQGCAGLAAGALALAWQSIALGVLAYLMIIILPYRGRLLDGARRLRGAGLALPSEPAALDGDVGRAVFLEARKSLGAQAQNRIPNLAASMEQLLDAATVQHPSWGASLLLGFALLVSLVMAAAAFVLLSQHRAG
jgi:Zn-dependent protease